MSWLFPLVLGCIQHQHDSRLLILAALVCVVGVYAAFAVAAHSARSHGRSQMRWGLASVVAAGSTAWATHFIILLAFQPGLPVGFEPTLTVTSLFSAMLGIGLGIALVLTSRSRPMRFLSGLVLGSGITTLHYLGQAAYSTQARVEWNMALVGASVAIGLVLCGWAMVFVASRRRSLRPLGAPLLLIAIAVIHFSGMAAMVITPDATVQLPSTLIPDAIVTVTVASVSISLLLLAIAGWRMDLSAKRRLIMDRRRVRELADVALEGLLICHSDQIVTVNRSLVRLVGASEEALRGMRVGQVLPGLDPALLAEREEHDAVLTGADGSSLPVRVLRSEVILGHKPHTVIAVRDQRERLRTEAEMRALAYSDALTGLANRKRFTDLLDHEIRSTALGRSEAAILMLDLDSFKLINDTLGHHAGDEVLREVARRLDRLLEGLGVAARLGGDEFAILLPSTGRQVDLQGIAAQIMEALGASGVKVDGHSLSIAASLGGARGLEPSDGPKN
jgi:diguanylate cyclase (GGDEF)-like protein